MTLYDRVKQATHAAWALAEDEGHDSEGSDPRDQDREVERARADLRPLLRELKLDDELRELDAAWETHGLERRFAGPDGGGVIWYYCRILDIIEPIMTRVELRLSSESRGESSAATPRVPDSAVDARALPIDGGEEPPVTSHEGVSDAVDVLIICALKEELDALLEVGEGVLEPWTEVAGDPPYLVATLQGAAGQIRVAAARLTRTGGVATAAAATTLTARLTPSCLAMCGVCAGHPEDTDLGDVVIADRVFQHDVGKLKSTGFEGDISTHILDDRWLRIAQDLAGAAKGLFGYAEPDEEAACWWFLERLLDGREPQKSGFDRYFRDEHGVELLHRLEQRGHVGLTDVYALTPAGAVAVKQWRARHRSVRIKQLPYHVHVAPLGSGNYVAADGIEWDRAPKLGMRKTLGIEMEAATVGEVAATNRLRFVVTKGVMDHGDRHKADRFKQFAARASAEVLCVFLRRVVRPANSQAQAAVARNSDEWSGNIAAGLANSKVRKGGTANRASSGPDVSDPGVDVGAAEISDERDQAMDSQGLDEHLRNDTTTPWLAWPMPRGYVLLTKTPATGMVADYYHSGDGWRYGTHFHPSYERSWQDVRRRQEQAEKMHVPAADLTYADRPLSALVQIGRDYESGIGFETAIGLVVEQHPQVVVVSPGQTISHRDVIARFEDANLSKHHDVRDLIEDAKALIADRDLSLMHFRRDCRDIRRAAIRHAEVRFESTPSELRFLDEVFSLVAIETEERSGLVQKLHWLRDLLYDWL